jgi:hypothetical protein
MFTENICENDIITKIKTSNQMDEAQKQDFINLISYFTPVEIEELKFLI